MLATHSIPEYPLLGAALPDLVPALLLILDDDRHLTYALDASATGASEGGGAWVDPSSHHFHHQALALHALALVLRLATPADSRWFRGLILHALRRHLPEALAARREYTALPDAPQVSVRVVLEPLAGCLLLAAFGAAGCCRPPLLDAVQPINKV